MLTMQTNWTTIPQLLSNQLIQNPRPVQAFTEWKPLTVYSWSVGVQRELPWKFMADVAYVGNSNTNVARNIPINNLTPAQLVDPANLDPTQNNTQLKATDFLRPYPGYGNINERRYFDDGITYHSIQVGVTRRLSNGLSFSGAYTGTRRAGLQGWDWYRTDADNYARFTHGSRAAGRTTWSSVTRTRSRTSRNTWVTRPSWPPSSTDGSCPAPRSCRAEHAADSPTGSLERPPVT